jgi:hypothetical protein
VTSPAVTRRRWWHRDGVADPDAEAALLLDEVLAAAGQRAGRCDRPGVRPVVRSAVLTSSVVGTVARRGDFDRGFRPLRPELRGRWERVADRMASGGRLEPVSLVRVGALYFVVDGHHRVSVARALGLEVVPAVVRSFCTTALVDAGLARADLDRKAAEREFLRDVPLPDSATWQLRLDRPDRYPRLASAARDWCAAAGLVEGRPAGGLDDAAAAAWWGTEVLPTACRLGLGASAPGVAAAYLDSLGL